MSLVPTPEISVVVCTRNRSSLLGRVCEEVLRQDLPGGRWELVIVDNGSTDDTVDIARAVESEHPEKVRVVRESVVGLSAARNRGVREARGEAVVFLDDDAFPVAGWLAGLARALCEDGVQCAGGPVDPQFQGELPDWFLGRFLPYLSAWDLGDSERELTYDEYPRGANIGFRREVFDEAGLFSTHLGRKGSDLLSCEEIELCLRIERLGGRIRYVPESRIRHLIDAERISRRWLARRFEAQGKSEAIINWRHGGIGALHAGSKVMLNRWRERAREGGADNRLIVRCQRGAFLGYLKGCLRAVATVDRCRWPEDRAPAPWAPFH
jgi:glycosyltransferase involved in cell wall biosynthesis